MNKMERAALQHVAEELAYRKSPQYELDRAKDAERRRKSDKSTGHTPLCTLSRCHNSCKKA